MSEFSNVYMVQLVYNVGTSVTGRTDIKAFLIIIIILKKKTFYGSSNRFTQDRSAGECWW